MYLVKRKYLTVIFIIFLGLTYSVFFIHQVSKNTLLNKQWIYNQYGAHKYYEQISDVIHQDLNASLFETTGISYVFKDIVTDKDAETLMSFRTDQLLLLETPEADKQLNAALNTFVNRISSQLSFFVLTDVQKQAIIDQFSINMKGHFIAPINGAPYNPQIKEESMSLDVVRLTSRQDVFYSSLIINVIALVSLYFMHRKRISELMIQLCTSVIFTGSMLFFPFVWAHNVYYQRSYDSLFNIKYNMLYRLMNDVFKSLYTTGYVIIIVGIIIYVLIFGYRYLKYYYFDL